MRHRLAGWWFPHSYLKMDANPAVCCLGNDPHLHPSWTTRPRQPHCGYRYLQPLRHRSRQLVHHPHLLSAVLQRLSTPRGRVQARSLLHGRRLAWLGDECVMHRLDLLHRGPLLAAELQARDGAKYELCRSHNCRCDPAVRVSHIPIFNHLCPYRFSYLTIGFGIGPLPTSTTRDHARTCMMPMNLLKESSGVLPLRITKNETSCRAIAARIKLRVT
jgi:hypothetical protein